jgi:hypothetical protein
MTSTRNSAFWLVLGVGLLLGSAVVPARADEGCIDFKWDVSKERALYAGTPAPLTAGKDAKSAPAVVPNRLYKLQLVGQDQVTFAASPGKQATAAPAFAGLATLKIPAAGDYRVAVDLPIWIDVASRGTLVPAKDFEGQHSCGAPHKIVVFELTAAQPLVLQFSNARVGSMLLTVTASPPRKF